MKCPADGETLVMTDRSGIEIDYCPKCRGVWLDRGELDKIIERSVPAAPAAPSAPQMREAPRREEPREDRRGGFLSGDDYDDDDHRRHGKGKRREGFLSDLFDF